MLTGLIGYALMLGWAACSGGGGSGGGFLADGGPRRHRHGGTNPVLPSANAEQSGGRSKRRLIGSDGSSQFVGWVDTARGETCGFQRRAGDGKYRCLPSGENVDVGLLLRRSELHRPGVDQVPAARYEVPPDLVDTSSCCPAASPPSTHYKPAGQLFYKNSSGECESRDPSPDYVIYGAGNPIPWTDFMESAEQLDP
ncbi:MAG: hypothetical protein U0263_39755 [Polyangiaceae bacterium]